MNNKRTHEIYHGKTRYQKKLIDDKNFTYRLLMPVIKESVSTKSKILDIGCGAGTLDLYLAGYCTSITGVDISEKAIKACRKSAALLNINNANFKTLNFPERTLTEKFDVIIFTEVIEHLKDGNKAIKMISKLLNKNGLLILSTPSKNAPLYRWGLLENFERKVGHLQRYDEKELFKMLENNAMTVIKTKKVEGIIRNFLFTNDIAGTTIRFLKYFLSDLITIVDKLTIPLLGESNYIIVSKKK